MPNTNADIRQQILLALETSGFDQLDAFLATLARAQAALAAVNQAEGAATTTSKATETAVYETAGSYEVLEPAIKRASTATEKAAVANQWMGRQTKELSDLLQDLAQHERTAATEAKAVADTSGKAGEATTKASNAGGYGALKWMLLGNSVQDAQYGFAAIVNNIPQLVLAFGGGPGLAGVLSLAAVAMQQLLGHSKDIAEFFGKGLPQDLIGDVKLLQERLNELDAKPIKLKADFLDIRLAREELKRLTDQESAYQRLKSGKTEEQQQRSKAISAAIVDLGGTGDYTSGVDQVIRGVAASTETEAPKAKAVREKIEMTRKHLDEATDPDVIAGQEAALARYNDQLKTIISTHKENNERAARAMVTEAAEGNEQQRKRLQEVYEANQKRFAALGVKPEFGQAIAAAAPEAMAHTRDVDAEFEQSQAEGAESIRLVKQRFDEARRKAKQAEAERKARTGQDVARVAPGFDENLEAGFHEALKQGVDADVAARSMRGPLVQKLRERGVEEDIVADVASALLQKGIDSAKNLIAEGKTPRAAARAGREATKDVNEADRQVGAGYQDAWTSGLYKAAKAGQDLEATTARERPKLTGALQARGVDPAIVGAVADQIIAKARAAALNAVASGAPPKLVRQEAAAETKQVGKLDDGFKAPLAAAIASNRYAQTVGDPSAVREAALGRELQSRVGRKLRDSGQDARLAPQIVADAFQQSNAQMTRMMAEGLNQQQALIAIVEQAQANMLRMQNQLAQNGVAVRHLSIQARRSAQNRGPLLPAMGPGFN